MYCDISGRGSEGEAIIVPLELMIGSKCAGMKECDDDSGGDWRVEGSRSEPPKSTEQENLTRGGGGSKRSSCSSIAM